MTKEEVKRRLAAIGYPDNSPDRCFKCSGHYNLNWLPEVQDLLEDMGAQPIDFCEISCGFFRLGNGRLRLANKTQCIHLRQLREWVYATADQIK